MYRKALNIAKKNGNDEQQARSYACLGFLASLQCDYQASKKWYEKSLESNERRGAMDHAANCCTSLGNLCLGKAAGQPRDFDSAKKWFRKALEFNDDTTWWDWLTLYGRLWRYRFLEVFSK